MNRWPIRLAVGVAAIVAAAAQGWFLGAGIGAMDYTEPRYSTHALADLYRQGASWKFGPRFAADIELLPRVAAGDGWTTDALNLGFHFQF